ncbi:MAG: hypothetical protein WA194_02165 [Patescibacteria group bacterium]
MAGEKWEAAKNEALKNGDVISNLDVNQVFNSAKDKIKKSLGSVEKGMSMFKDVAGEKLDAKAAEAIRIMQSEGASGAERVVNALFRYEPKAGKEIDFSAPKIAAAPAAAPHQQTAKADLSNLTAYASGSVRAQQMKEMGL